MKIVITIPAYNEESTLPKVLQEIAEEMKKAGLAYTFLVLDDGSTDRTNELAKKAGALVVSNKRNLGLAETFKRELEECVRLQADIIVHTDADGQYPARFIPLLIREVEKGHDLVLGSRFAGNPEGIPLMKRLGNIAFAKVLSKLTKTKLTDTTTGFRAFTREVAEKIKLINTFTYTQEQIIRATKQGFSIKEIPIESRKTRKSKLFKSSFQYAWRAWINILRIYRDYEPLKFFGRIGGIFFIVGALLGLYVLYEVLTTGHAGGIPRTILSAVLIMSGIQIMLFGFLADMSRGK